MSNSTASPRQIAEAAQNLAADPNASVLVSANAGSGKTHVLINRVTRILLSGAAPEQILCVTYTKAAASEMLNRLFAHLGKFSILPDEELRAELRKLEPKLDPGSDELAKARRLFARALETPGGLKIRTIHGFCESLLRQFPIEAGLSPGFALLDDKQSAALQEKLIQQIGKQAVDDPNGRLAEAFEVLSNSGSGTTKNIFETAKANAEKLALDLLGTNSLSSAIENSADSLQLDVQDTQQSVCDVIFSQLDHAELQEIATGLSQGSATNQKRAKAIVEAMEQTDAIVAVQSLIRVLLKKDFTRFKTFVSVAAAKQMPELPEKCLRLEENAEAAVAKLQAVKTFQLTKAALTLCHGFITSYHQAKRSAGLIDFDDLIEYSKQLLSTKASKDWVLYKLDGNLRHVLVDEAQDNSPAQWQVIAALTDEFFAGMGAHDETRTLFSVGDPKQSIYRFQGADPSLFLAQKSRLLEYKANLQAPIHIPEMSLSWRSSPQVLEFVDACFSNPLETKLSGDLEKFIAQQDPNDSHLLDPGFADYLKHGAERDTAIGSVTLLPAIPYNPVPADENPSRPVDAVSSTAPESLLAADIASRIKNMLGNDEQIEDNVNGIPSKRAITGGDILILVRSRSNLFREIIRHLKLQSIPVAGADKMVLQSETSVLDLLSIAKAALQPADDLSLAEVLTGPLLHPKLEASPPINQQILFDLAYNRDDKETLYSALKTSSIPELSEAKTWIADLIQRAGHETPYRFFSGLLYRPSATGESVIERVFARLGKESEDPIQEFLNLALAFSRSGDGSLFSFVTEMQTREDMIKRELQAAGNQVRVMTVHGAKGLEAPFVILPDTTKGYNSTTKSGLVRTKSAWLWLDTDDKSNKPIQEYRDRQTLLEAQEHKRLLYVALTRARDHLLICGYQRGDNEKTGGFGPDSWYLQCEEAFKSLVESKKAQVLLDNGEPVGFQLGCPMQAASEQQKEKAKPDHDLPKWALKSLNKNLEQAKQRTPSNLLNADDDTMAAPSPIGPGAAQRFLRGNMIHALLQSLPDLPIAERSNAADKFLEQQPDLSQSQRSEIKSVTLAVLNDQKFAELFAANSRAELPITGTINSEEGLISINGKIDRLVVSKTEILVLDFKTNRPAPTEAKHVPAQYLAQMASYRALLQQIWPQRQIRCALLWTDGPNLMEISDAMLDSAKLSAPEQF